MHIQNTLNPVIKQKQVFKKFTNAINRSRVTPDTAFTPCQLRFGHGSIP